MATYRIMRIYDVPGKDQVEATNRMMEAIALGVESDYHTVDFIKSPDDARGKGSKVNLKPPKGWLATFLDQITGR